MYTPELAKMHSFVLMKTVLNIKKYLHVFAYEMNFTLCVLLVYNDNGSVQTLCITRVSALCTKGYL